MVWRISFQLFSERFFYWFCVSGLITELFVPFLRYCLLQCITRVLLANLFLRRLQYFMYNKRGCRLPPIVSGVYMGNIFYSAERKDKDYLCSECNFKMDCEKCTGKEGARKKIGCVGKTRKAR